MTSLKLTLLMSLFVGFAAVAAPADDLDKLKLEKQKLQMQREIEEEKAKLEKSRREMKQQADQEMKEIREKSEKAEKETENKNLMNPYGLGVGLHVGFAIASADVEPASGTGNRFTPSMGLFIDAPVLPGFLSFQPEINYVSKGGTNTHFGAQATTKLNYLEVPLLAKIKFMVPRVRPFVIGGPSMGFTLSREVEGNIAAMNNLNGFELALMLGAGFSYQLGDAVNSTELVFSARYSTGITDIDTTVNAWHSRTFMLMVGAQF